MSHLIFLVSFLFGSNFALAKDIQTNAVLFKDAPDWLKRSRADKIIDRIQTKLEWSIRRITANWYQNQNSFEKAHAFGPLARAVTKTAGTTASLHFGPSVNTQNFDQVFAHELVHVIIHQKYKGSIPKWLEEGLANHLARKSKVNYQWLAKQDFPQDVRDLADPFSASSHLPKSPKDVRYRYMASQAFAEMLEKKCDLENLIRLSVQRKMENYMRTYCEIQDLNQAFRDWIKSQAKS